MIPPASGPRTESPASGQRGCRRVEGVTLVPLAPPGAGGSLQVLGFQLFWNNVPCKRICSSGRVIDSSFLPSSLNELPHSHTDSNFSIRKTGIFSH